MQTATDTSASQQDFLFPAFSWAHKESVMKKSPYYKHHIQNFTL